MLNSDKQNYKPEKVITHACFVILLIILTNLISCSYSPSVFTITASAGSNGSISPSDTVLVNSGDDILFTITPDARYEVLDVLVDSSSVGAVGSYKINNVTSDHTISATFEAIIYEIVYADNPYIQYTGRFDYSDPKKVSFAWPGVSISAVFEGAYCAIYLNQYPLIPDNKNYKASFYNVFIDDNDEQIIIKARSDNSLYTIADDLYPGQHTITIFKRTEAFCGRGEFLAFELEEGKKLLPPPSRPERKIEFIGNSITCGYGNEEYSGKKFTGATENSYLSYGAITARNLDAEYHLISYSAKGVHKNSIPSDTNTLPKIYDRIDPTNSIGKWDFASWIPDAIVINLGTNDFGSGILPDSTEFINDYVNFILTINANYPDATFFCVDGPMEGYYLTNKYNDEQIPTIEIMRSYIKKTIENAKSNGIENIYSFSLTLIDHDKGFGAEGHPNVYQHKINAEELTEFIKMKMNW